MCSPCSLRGSSPTRSSRLAARPRRKCGPRLRRAALSVAAKPDSHDICFIADGDTRAFLGRQLGERSGPMVDVGTGQVVGRHGGSFGYTVGQRRGLRLDRPAPGGELRYVLSIQPTTNTVVVGPGELLDTDEVVGAHPVWTLGDAPGAEFDCAVQLRAHGMVSPATVRVTDAEVTARLERPQRGIAAGQAMVMYDGDSVLGSATISRVSTVGVLPAVAGRAAP